MKPLKENIQELLLPGFAKLPLDQQETFFETEAGDAFETTSLELLRLIKNYESIENSLLSWFIKAPNVKQQIDEAVKKFNEQYQNNSHYKEIFTACALVCLTDLEPSFAFLSDDEKENLIPKLEVKILLQSLSAAKKHNLFYENDKAMALEQSTWQAFFQYLLTHENTFLLRRALHQKESEHLANFFPALYYQKKLNEPEEITALQSTYLTVEAHGKTQEEKYRENFLTIQMMILHVMENVTQHYLNADIDETIHNDYAKKITTTLLRIFDRHKKQTFTYNDIEAELEEWANKIQEKALFLNGKPYQKRNKKALGTFSLQDILDHPLTKKTRTVVEKLADAHAFIQATSFSTQNESSLLAILDFYNYGRYANNISTIKNIIWNFLLPFQPLYEEYRLIAQFEKNHLLKLVKGAIPLLIILGVIIGISLAVAPLALPELVFTLVFLLSIVAGAALATCYVATKNNLYDFLRTCWYGRYQVPEFKVNTRINAIFGTNAISVRNFYVHTIQNLDNHIATYKKRMSRDKNLTESELAHLKHLIDKRNTLWLEWFDIHSNVNVGINEALCLAEERIKEEADNIYQKIKNCPLAKTLTLSIKETLLPEPNAQGKHKGVLKIHHTSPSFFRQQKTHLEKLCALDTSIQDTKAQPTIQ